MISTDARRHKRSRREDGTAAAKIGTRQKGRKSAACAPGCLPEHQLRALLYPITPETFFAEYWGRKPLFIKGRTEKLQTLFGTLDLKDLQRSANQSSDGNNKEFALWSQTLRPSGDARPQDITDIRPDHIERAVAEGLNVACANFTHRKLASFAASVKAQLNHPGSVRVAFTVSPKGNGWPLHVDNGSVFNIQCEGRKRFRISPDPQIEWPLGSVIFSEDGSAESFLYEAEEWEVYGPVDVSGMLELVMEPGDVLYWPAGTIHGTEALSGPTINVAVVLDHAGFLDLVASVLKEMLGSNPAWRHLPTINPMRAEPGHLPSEAVEFFAARLDELRKAVTALTPESLELNRQWHTLIANPGEATLSNMPLGAKESSRKTIRRSDVLRLSTKAPITYAVGTNGDGEKCLHLYFTTKEVSVAGEWVPFLKRMLEKGRFVAESATRWTGRGKRYPWATVKEYFQTLLEQGVLERDCEMTNTKIELR